METFGKIMALLMVLIITPIIRGFVLVKLWVLFVIPIFNVPVIGIAQAIGISLVIGFLTAQKPVKQEIKKNKDVWDDFLTSFFTMIVASLVILAFAWIINQFL